MALGCNRLPQNALHRDLEAAGGGQQHAAALDTSVLLPAPERDVDAADKDGKSPLHSASVKGHHGVAAVLLGRAGVKPPPSPSPPPPPVTDGTRKAHQRSHIIYQLCHLSHTKGLVISSSFF